MKDNNVLQSMQFFLKKINEVYWPQFNYFPLYLTRILQVKKQKTFYTSRLKMTNENYSYNLYGFHMS